jgi:hypothetical protein
MAGRGNPSFLKNQKARKRQEKAAAKRAARQARRDDKANRGAPGTEEPLDETLGLDAEGSAEGAETNDENEAGDETSSEEIRPA